MGTLLYEIEVLEYKRNCLITYILCEMQIFVYSLFKMYIRLCVSGKPHSKRFGLLPLSTHS